MEPRFPEPRMRDDFRRELRTKLILEAQAALAPAPRDSAWRTWLRPALGFGVAAVVLVTGAGTAAAGSVAGDATFTLKKAAEDVQVALTFDDVQRVQLLAEIADRRLSELQTVADRPDRAPVASEEYAKAVTTFRAAVNALQQAAPTEKGDRAQDVADAARDKHEAIIDVLEPTLPDDAKPAIERAKLEENKDNAGGPDRTGRPDRTRSPQPSRTPRPTGTVRVSDAPRATERPASPRPSGSVRASPRASGEAD